MVSIHAPRVGRDSSVSSSPTEPTLFQSTRPAWGATRDLREVQRLVGVSIHAPRVGRDLALLLAEHLSESFNPRAPRGARHRPSARTIHPSCFNPRAPRGARLLRAERSPEPTLFQSTRPAWGATNFLPQEIDSHRSFNPRAPRGARPRLSRSRHSIGRFNPRAPRGARLRRTFCLRPSLLFQSTRPAWGATETRQCKRRGFRCFNPRAPRGARHALKAQQVGDIVFQSTRPAWGATLAEHRLVLLEEVSIHAPRVGRDVTTP